ncbi:MAG: cyclic pyranopterin monophosphate synthase MoaC [Planctomycetota bacterium]
MAEASHFDSRGRARMVDVSDKPETLRRAEAACRVCMGPEAAEAARSGRAAKGDVLAAARLAGVQAAKRTPELIPLCHAIRLTRVSVDLDFEDESTLVVHSEALAVDRTGAEMEALLAASVAALTVYDMLKALDRTMVVTDLRLLAKSGGRSGAWQREEP